MIFSVSKDHNACAWYSHNGERFGVYKGHQGALWTVDVDPHTTLLATGGADNTMRLWEVKTGKLLKTWEYGTAIKRCEFSDDGTQLLSVTEKRQGQLSTINVYDINPDPEAEQSSEHTLRIVVDELPKVTVAGFSALSRYIISCHEDGSVSQWDAKVRAPTQSNDAAVRLPLTRSPLSLVNFSTTSSPMRPTCSSPICNGHQTAPTSSPPARTRPQRY